MQPSSKKSIIILIVVLVLGALAYFYFAGTPTDSSSLVAGTDTGTDPGLVGAKVLTLLNQINSLKIDNTFFQSTVYSTLVDHTVPIYEQGVGKPNPFLNPHPKTSPAH